MSRMEEKNTPCEIDLSNVNCMKGLTNFFNIIL